MSKGLTTADMQEAVDAVALHGSVSLAATAMKMSRQTFDHRYQEARRKGIAPKVAGGDTKVEVDNRVMRDQIKMLEATIKKMGVAQSAEDRIFEEVFALSRLPVEPPEWTLPEEAKKDHPGIPHLFLSDLHWGEVVRPSQINGKNQYSVAIAKKRMRRTVETAINLCFNHMKHPTYPGIVLCLGGDNVSGDIHEELSETNELTSAQTLIDMTGTFIWVIDTLVKAFGKVWVVGVAGNHGRMHKKPRAKNRAITNFDWVIYQLVRQHFANDSRISWLIPEGPDAWFRVYNHRFLLTHGDQFRGGDGIIGALGPILRGDTKKRSRNMQIDMGYDTMLLGHWHQWIALRRVIVNGSMKGYDEYADQNNFAFEEPIQGLWFVHRKYGLTCSWPIYCDEPSRTYSGAPVQLGLMQ